MKFQAVRLVQMLNLRVCLSVDVQLTYFSPNVKWKQQLDIKHWTHSDFPEFASEKHVVLFS